ncbi:Uncharacterised protein [Pragia fontium]|uniref:hypothetical protein n=1 Tax=Pragia fontium TaxID=82985 RepID=UPI000E07C939|nr:hypothetical protein [Pragia fontium]SUB83053.1 Uncharacterised protein [Pragia fontium]
MLKKLLIVAFSFSVFACTDSTENKFITYCMDTLNKYGSATKEQCSCNYDYTSKKLSKSQMDEIVSAPYGSQGPLSTKGEMYFITAGNESGCFE